MDVEVEVREFEEVGPLTATVESGAVVPFTTVMSKLPFVMTS